MKKLITFSMLLGFGCVYSAHSAQFDWQISGMRVPGSSPQSLVNFGTDPTDVSVYLVYAGGNGVVDLDMSSGQAVFSGGDVVIGAGGVTLTSNGKVGVADYAQSGFDNAGLTKNQSINVYAIAFYRAAGSVTKDNSTQYYATGTFATTVPDWGNGSQLPISVNFGSLTLVDGGGNYTPWTTTPVPEPTSMALFGLGAVVLGLRRRFKKKA